MLSPNVIIPFDGNHASIPAGFARDTRFDGKYPKGATGGWGDTGGASTHQHTFAHVHAISSHVHSINLSNPINGNNHSMGNSGGLANADHGHTANSTTSNGENCQSTSATLDAYSCEPPYYTVIFIKSNAYNAIPVNGMVFSSGNRPGLTYHAASENKFLKGADTGANAGGTGGVATHAHTQSHTHSANNHSHNQSPISDSHNDGEGGGSTPKVANGGHRHYVDLAVSAQGMNANTTSSDSQALEPAHKTIKHYIATQQTLPQPGDIAMITEAENPPGWITCDGSDGTPDLTTFYIKNTQTAGVSAGANTHTHTVSHAHTGNGTHTHSATSPTSMSDDDQGRNGSGKTGRENHRHNVNSVSSVTANYDTTAATTTEESNEPPYILVRFIQLKYTVAGGALLALL